MLNYQENITCKRFLCGWLDHEANMIHQRYDTQQVLWFLRNYWKFTRENMIKEWHKTFNDQGFGKSQYQWLKNRYGKKAEWGASLNHPPYPGARPGGSGTEMYEPPNVPIHFPSGESSTIHTPTETPHTVINGTYSFDLTGGLGSPFMSTSTSVGNVIPDSSMNALIARHSTGYYPSTTNLAASSATGQFALAGLLGLPDDPTANAQYQLQASYPFTSAPAVPLGGEFYSSNPINLFSAENASRARSGLATIDADEQCVSAPAISAAGSAPSATKPNGPAANLATTCSRKGNPKSTEIAKSNSNAAQASDPASKSMVENVVPSNGPLSPARLAGKRKRASMGVTHQPPKQSLLDPDIQMVGNGTTGASIKDARLPTALMQNQGTRPERKKSKQKKSVFSPAQTTTSTSPSSATVAHLEGTSEWHNGIHDDCHINVCHRHQEGGIFIPQPNDVAAADTSHNSTFMIDNMPYNSVESTPTSQPDADLTIFWNAGIATSVSTAATAATALSPLFSSPPGSQAASCNGNTFDETVAKHADDTECSFSDLHMSPRSDKLLSGSPDTGNNLSDDENDTASALANAWANSAVDAVGSRYTGVKQSPPPTAGIHGHDLAGAELPSTFWDLSFPNM